MDAYQGYENHIVILDFVATEQVGFLAEMHRLVVALSRARDALYVLANKTAWDQFKKMKRHVSKMLSQLLPYRVQVQEEVTCNYFDPQHFEKQPDAGVNMPDDNADGNANDWAAQPQLEPTSWNEPEASSVEPEAAPTTDPDNIAHFLEVDEPVITHEPAAPVASASSNEAATITEQLGCLGIPF